KAYALWFNANYGERYNDVIFIDKTSFNLHTRRSQGRSGTGNMVNIPLATVRGRSVTLILSISSSNVIYKKIINNSTVNANIFTEYFQELCHYVKNNMNRDNACFILDNARIHKSDEISRITTEYGFSFKFLSSYSYMLNPIENSFSKIKNSVKARLAAGEGGTLVELISNGVLTITSEDCEGYFRYMFRNITNSAAELPYIHQ
ncbi:hypothetical protein CDIK_4534, partial [Cucumispora dikerogammari]